MSCYTPMHGYRATNCDPETGKYAFTLKRPKDVHIDDSIPVPCGKCLGCRSDQRLMWSVRCYHELTQHDKACFLTLTYDDEHLPKNLKLDKSHLQNFFKTLRKHYKIRYFACGEYGEQTHRPHYHAIIFGEDFKLPHFDLANGSYKSPLVEQHWGHKGNVHITPVNMSTICYTCGYTAKKMHDDDTFNLMSRRPGLGHTWLKKYINDISKHGFITIEGKQFQIPPRYLLWEPEELDAVKMQRTEHARISQLSEKELNSKKINRQVKVDNKKFTKI